MKSDKSILEGICWRFRNYQNEKILKENSRIRLLVYKASQTSDKTVKAKIKCSSTEGTPMVGYLIVEDEKINYIADYSRDRFGAYAFEKYDCNKLSIGTFAFNDKKGEMVFTPLEEKDLAGKTLSLQCKTENREFIF